MIPLNTPPGTEVICVDDGNIPLRVKSGFVLKSIIVGLDGLKKGSLYTVRDWVQLPHLEGTHVRLQEIIRPIHEEYTFKIEPGYDPVRFRLLEIHPSLTELLNSVKHDNFEKV